MSQKAKLRREAKGKVKITEAFGFRIGDKCILKEEKTDSFTKKVTTTYFWARVAEFTSTTIGVVKAYAIVHTDPAMVLPASWLADQRQMRREARQRAVRRHFEYIDAMTDTVRAEYQARAFAELQTANLPLIPRRRGLSPSMSAMIAGAAALGLAAAASQEYRR